MPSSSLFIACKIYLTPTEQIRRIRVQAPPNTSFSDFQTAVSQLYAYIPQYQQQEQYLIYITYLDEENDWVTVSSESEWNGALARQVQLLDESSQASEQLFKIRCQMMLKPTFQATDSSSSIGSQYEQQQQQHVIGALSSTARTLVDKETWKPLIEQVKRGGTRVQPYVEQAKDKTVETAKRVQEWVTDPVKRQEAKKWIQKMSEEGGTMAHDMFNEMYKEFESMLLSQIARIIISGGDGDGSDGNFNNVGSNNVEQQEQTQEQEQEQNDIAAEEEYSSTYEHLLLIDNDHLIDTDSEEEEEQEEEEEEEEQEEFIIVQNEVPQAPVQEEEESAESMSPVSSSFVYHQIEEPAQPFLFGDDSFIVMDEPQEEEELQGNEEYISKVKILQEMGFSNGGLNLQLLNEKNGDIVAVVAELLATTL